MNFQILSSSKGTQFPLDPILHAKAPFTSHSKGSICPDILTCTWVPPKKVRIWIEEVLVVEGEEGFCGSPEGVWPTARFWRLFWNLFRNKLGQKPKVRLLPQGVGCFLFGIQGNFWRKTCGNQTRKTIIFKHSCSCLDYTPSTVRNKTFQNQKLSRLTQYISLRWTMKQGK